MKLKIEFLQNKAFWKRNESQYCIKFIQQLKFYLSVYVLTLIIFIYSVNCDRFSYEQRLCLFRQSTWQ